MKISQMVDEPTIPPAIGPANSEGIAIVEVGAKPVKYHVHKALLVFHSEYFRKALQGPWKEAHEGAVRLSDAGAAEFNVFVHWLYTQQLPLTSHMIAHISGDEREHASGLALVKAYALGDRLLAFGFRRAINNHVVGPYGGIAIAPRAYVPAVRWAFENIPCERPLLQFLVNDFCANWYAKHDNKDDVEALRQFPMTFIMRAMRRYSLAREDEGDGCFLEHATVAERRSCKHTHPEYTTGHDGYGYVGELDD